MTPSQVNADVARIERDALSAISKLCERIRRENIIPLCDKKGWRFISGNGVYAFCSGSDRPDFWHDEKSAIKAGIPAYLYRILETPSQLLNNNCLGSYMEDYTPENYSNP